MPRKIKALVEDVDTEEEWLELLSKEVLHIIFFLNDVEKFEVNNYLKLKHLRIKILSFTSFTLE